MTFGYDFIKVFGLSVSESSEAEVIDDQDLWPEESFYSFISGGDLTGLRGYLKGSTVKNQLNKLPELNTLYPSKYRVVLKPFPA